MVSSFVDLTVLNCSSSLPLPNVGEDSSSFLGSSSNFDVSTFLEELLSVLTRIKLELFLSSIEFTKGETSYSKGLADASLSVQTPIGLFSVVSYSASIG